MARHTRFYALNENTLKKATEKIAHSTRTYRKLHHWIALPLFLFMFLIGLTGLLLGWKKNTGLLPKTATGANLETSYWIPVDSMVKIAHQFATDSLQKSQDLDRIDIRPEKGIAKIVYKNHYSEIQIDLSSGAILSSKARYSDIIENIHDGSIFDFLLKTPNGEFKLAYTTLLSIGLMLLSFSGFWLWLNPRRIRKIKSSHAQH